MSSHGRPLIFFNPWKDTEKTRNHLPHWHQAGATYFFTYRLADSIPAEQRVRWSRERTAWLQARPQPWSSEIEREYHDQFTARMERWLDAGSGSCALRQPESRRIVAGSLAHFESERYVHHAWVIMPNHVHTLTSLHPEWEMDRVLQTWKGYTALEINRLRGTQGTFWQEDYFNRLIRDRDHFVNVLRYIRRNPSSAHLDEDAFTSYERPDLTSW